MLDKFRATAIDIGLSESQIVPDEGNLLGLFVETTKPPMDREQLSNFDLVAICMALHHIDDIDMAIKRLSERLRPGGVLLVVDWAKRDTASNSAGMDNQNAHHQHQHQYHHPQHQNRRTPRYTPSHTIVSRRSRWLVSSMGHSSFVRAERLSDVPGARTGKMQLFFARATKL